MGGDWRHRRWQWALTMLQNYASCWSLEICIYFFKKRLHLEMGPLMQFQKAYDHQWTTWGLVEHTGLPGNSRAFPETWQLIASWAAVSLPSLPFPSPQILFVSCQLNFYVSAISTLQNQFFLQVFIFIGKWIAKILIVIFLSLNWKCRGCFRPAQSSITLWYVFWEISK